MCLILALPEANVEEKKNTIFGLGVCQFCKMIFFKGCFLVPNFVKFVPEICLLPCMEITSVLKQLNLTIYLSSLVKIKKFRGIPSASPFC